MPMADEVVAKSWETQPSGEGDEEPVLTLHPRSTMHQPLTRERVARLEALLGDEDGLGDEKIISFLVYFRDLVRDLDVEVHHLAGDLEACHQCLEVLRVH